MTDKAFPRQRFSRDLVFVVQRPVVMNGESLVPGTIFDKALVSDRKLRQLYDQRYLRFAEGNEAPPPSLPKRAQPRARLRLPRIAEEVNHGSSKD